MEQRWHGLFKEKFSRHYDLRTVYILDHVREQGYAAFVDWLNAYIKGTDARLVLLDIEFFFGFGIDLILRITKDVRIVLTTFDDIVFHEMNYINALGCDLVTCADPIAVLKYHETGVKAELLFLENSRVPFDEFQETVKDIDVLFFGDLTKSGRSAFIEGLIASGIEVRVHCSAMNGELSYSELAHLISRSKVVLNLSQTHTVMKRPEAFVPVWSFWQFKGRVIEAGLGRAACVSEYAPSIEYLFGNETVLMFRTEEECAEIIRGLLDNPVRLAELSARLREMVLASFEQESQVQRLVVGVKKLHAVLGASLGGFLSQLLATRYPERVKNVVCIGTGTETTTYQRIINFEQITAIEGDPDFDTSLVACRAVLAEGGKPTPDTTRIDAKEVGDFSSGIIALNGSLDGKTAPALEFSG